MVGIYRRPLPSSTGLTCGVTFEVCRESVGCADPLWSSRIAPPSPRGPWPNRDDGAVDPPQKALSRTGSMRIQSRYRGAGRRAATAAGRPAPSFAQFRMIR
jgi:hypothetical protein